MDELEPFQDDSGEIRRCGSLETPEGLVSAFPPFVTAEENVWSESDIRRVLRASTRVPSRITFGDKWIQNQRSHGSCNGFALAGALARARYSSGHQDGLLFSGAYAYSLMNRGRDQGSVLEDGMRLVQSNGVCLETTVGWDQIYPSQYDKAKADAEAAKHKGLSCFRALSKEGWDTALATGLYFGIAAVHAGNNYQRLNSQGIAGVDNGGGNHAVCIDDICEVGGHLVYDQPGEWGLGYGNKGRSYLTWDSFAQTFERHVFYLVPNVQELN